MANTTSAKKAARKIARRTDRQQGSPVATAQLPRQGRRRDRDGRPREGSSGAQGGRTGHHAFRAERRGASQCREPEGLPLGEAGGEARQVTNTVARHEILPGLRRAFCYRSNVESADCGARTVIREFVVILSRLHPKLHQWPATSCFPDQSGGFQPAVRALWRLRY